MKTINFEKLHVDDPKVKYGEIKELLKTASTSPEELYSYFNEWIKLTDDSNNIVKWAGIDIIGYLAPVDVDNKIDDVVLQRLMNLFHDTKVITCNHAIFALGLVAENKNEYRERIINELLKVADNDFETDECEAIATGKVLETLTPFYDKLQDNKAFVDFVKFAKNSSRNSTRKKAEAVLKQIKK